jgi:hypothetical protein
MQAEIARQKRQECRFPEFHGQDARDPTLSQCRQPSSDALQDATNYGTIRRLATLTARASRQTEKYDCGGSQRKYP